MKKVAVSPTVIVPVERPINQTERKKVERKKESGESFKRKNNIKRKKLLGKTFATVVCPATSEKTASKRGANQINGSVANGNSGTDVTVD